MSSIMRHHAFAVVGTMFILMYQLGCYVGQQTVFYGIGRGVRRIGQSGLRAVWPVVSAVVVVYSQEATAYCCFRDSSAIEKNCCRIYENIYDLKRCTKTTHQWVPGIQVNYCCTGI